MVEREREVGRPVGGPGRRYVTTAAARPELPGTKLAAQAGYLRGHTNGGALLRRLHPAALLPARQEGS
jgi:hypothetical protein